MEQAKGIETDSYDYLFYTLSVLPYFRKSPAYEKLETLMPWHPVVQNHYGPAANRQDKETE